MKIKANVKLEYVAERLERKIVDEGIKAKIKFREQKRLFKSKIEVWITRYNPIKYEFYEDYIEEIVALSNDQTKIKKKVEKAVLDYFKENYFDVELVSALNNIEDKFKIEVDLGETNISNK